MVLHLPWYSCVSQSVQTMLFFLPKFGSLQNNQPCYCPDKNSCWSGWVWLVFLCFVSEVFSITPPKWVRNEAAFPFVFLQPVVIITMTLVWSVSYVMVSIFQGGKNGKVSGNVNHLSQHVLPQKPNNIWFQLRVLRTTIWKHPSILKFFVAKVIQ